MRSQLSAALLFCLAGIATPSWSYYIIVEDETTSPAYVVQKDKDDEPVVVTPPAPIVAKQEVVAPPPVAPNSPPVVEQQKTAPELKPIIQPKKTVRRSINGSCPNSNVCSKGNVQVASFSIPFQKGTSGLSKEATLQLTALLPRITAAGAKVCIIGRSDVRIFDESTVSKLATNRARKIREYLTLNGVPNKSISLSYSNIPNPPMNGGLMPSDITIYEPVVSGVAPKALSSPAPKSAPTSPLIQSSNRVGKNQIVEYIATAYTAGKITPDVTFKLLQMIQASQISNKQSQLKKL